MKADFVVLLQAFFLLLKSGLDQTANTRTAISNVPLKRKVRLLGLLRVKSVCFSGIREALMKSNSGKIGCPYLLSASQTNA